MKGIAGAGYAQIFEQLPQPILIWRLTTPADPPSMVLVALNPAAREWLDDERIVPGKTLGECVPTAVATGRDHIYADVIRTGIPRNLGQVQLLGGDHADRLLQICAFKVEEDCVAVCFDDVTSIERRRADDAFLESILENIPDMVFVKDARELRFVRVNRAGEALLGVARGDLLGKSDYDFFPPAQADFFTAKDRQVLATGNLLDIPEEPVLTRTKGTRLLHSKKIPIFGPDGTALFLLGISSDITLEREAERALERKTAIVGVLQSVAVAANTAATSGEAIRSCLERVCTHLGWSVGRLSGEASARWIYVAERPELDPLRLRLTSGALSGATALTARVRATGKPGWSTTVLEDPLFEAREPARAAGLSVGYALPIPVGTEVWGVLEFFSGPGESPDALLIEVMAMTGTQLGRVVERERAQTALEAHAEQMSAMSLVDELTGLYNRRGFLTLARQQLKVAARMKRRVCLFYADLDGMKAINDQHGHQAGDRALVDAANALTGTFRESDVVARLGGDEFAVWASDLVVDEAAAGVARLQARLAALNATPGRPFTLAMSVGVTAYDPEAPKSVEDLLQQADLAMYEMKRTRKLGPA